MIGMLLALVWSMTRNTNQRNGGNEPMKRATRKQTMEYISNLPKINYSSRIERGFASPGYIERFYDGSRCVLVLDVKTNFPRCQAYIMERASVGG